MARKEMCIRDSGMDHPVERLEKVVYPDAVRQLAGFDEIPLPFGQFPRGGFLLLDNQVAADLRPRVRYV